MKIIDLQSDTIKLPTEEMRRAMYEAELGDDVYQEDPTVNRLEELAAHMLGKDAALFTASGTMSNLIATLTSTRPGDEIILGSQSHMLWYEVGGAAALGGVVMRTIPDDQDGRIEYSALEQAIRPKNIHYPQTTLVCLENTHNRCGGTILTPEDTSTIANLAHQYGLRVHLDGAHIFNAAAALNVPVTELAKPVDSVCFCLSKGLSAPVGSLLCGMPDFVDKARKWRKMLGGGMRQSGVIAAGIIALQKMVGRLAEDHATAQQFARGLAQIPGIILNRDKVQTNIVMFESPLNISVHEFNHNMNSSGVKFTYPGERTVRTVTHRMVSTADIDEALNRVELVVRRLSLGKTGCS